ncbi:MAG TPA: thiamine pyrophosphate-dependent enzyme [Candidatus Limnocylindrales bacterium]|nr:thiamine pyrophosphate-dependent enzyme [Candidatus Limnocylindrales bacterium]
MLQRPDGLRAIADRYPDAPVLLTLGGTLREMLAVAGRRPNHLPILDAMGQPLALALGVSLGLERTPAIGRVIVIEGDGSLLMGFSSLATIGPLRPANLLAIIFDNGVYLATGGQPAATADVDFVGVAMACGWSAARDVDGDIDALNAALEWADGQDGPILLRVRVGIETIPTDFFLEDPVVLGRTFMDWLAERSSADPAASS